MPTDACDIVLSGPGRNALGSALMQRLLADVRAAGERPILLTGADGAFSAGLDLKEVAALDRPGMERFLGLLDDVIDALFLHPGPTVACVNGHAIAGGCMLALCCDLRVATEDPAVRIGLNEVPLGLEFPPKLLALARRRVPPHSLERVILEGALHDPRTALELGLVDEVTHDAHAVARARLERLASSPPAVYAVTKRTLRAGALDLNDDQRRYFRDVVVPAWCSDEVKARARAALAGRR